MIKIVGTDHKVAKQATCRHCGSILEYMPVDIKTRTSVDYSGSKDIVKYITCPSCSENVIV